jgi:hypothetical protein
MRLKSVLLQVAEDSHRHCVSPCEITKYPDHQNSESIAPDETRDIRSHLIYLFSCFVSFWDGELGRIDPNSDETK